jgi:hypothetical protein
MNINIFCTKSKMICATPLKNYYILVQYSYLFMNNGLNKVLIHTILRNRVVPVPSLCWVWDICVA